jgi:hypothetical protein
MKEAEALLDNYLKGMISEYADDALDLETTRKVSEFIASNKEAEEYLMKLQRLRSLTREQLADTEDDPTLDLRMMNELRLRSYDRTWWERAWDYRMFSPRVAVAVGAVFLLLVFALFTVFEKPVTILYQDTKARVMQMGDEAKTDLGERGRELSEEIEDLLLPGDATGERKPEAGAQNTGWIAPKEGCAA